jgi:DUF971 family protein
MKPVGVTANRNTRQVTIDWDDGHESVYFFTFLRNACPCAECRGGHEGMGKLPDLSTYALPEVDIPATRLRNLEAVGTYALTFEWEDGHHYGIYNWNYLRAICPCPTCRSERGDG